MAHVSIGRTGQSAGVLGNPIRLFYFIKQYQMLIHNNTGGIALMAMAQKKGGSAGRGPADPPGLRGQTLVQFAARGLGG